MGFALGGSVGLLRWIRKWWDWEVEGDHKFRTEDGWLDLTLDGSKTVTKTAETAWRDWLWGCESRVQRDDARMPRERGRQPNVAALQVVEGKGG